MWSESELIRGLVDEGRVRVADGNSNSVEDRVEWKE